MQHYNLTRRTVLNFSSYLQDLGIDRRQLASITGLSERTLRRYQAADAPEWLYLLSYCLAGYLPFEGWDGWQVTAQGLAHATARSTRHRPLMPEELKDLAFRLQYAHTLSRANNDLHREHTRLRHRLDRSSAVARLPKNLHLFPGVDILKIAGRL
jgi:hypothetical protein